VLVALVVGLVSLGAQPKRYHVDAAVSSSGNGLSWAKAMKTLQEGLKAAQPWDEVWVAAGTYVGGFTVPVYIKIYGGFEPGDTALTQRRPIQRPTKLDGANKQRVITVGDNSLVDGFVIQNGRGTAPGGGGLLILGGVSTVRNCLFTGNNLTAGRGSAVCVGPGTTLTDVLIENCVFFNNGTTTKVGDCIDIEQVRVTFRNLTVAGNNKNGLTFRVSGIALIYNSAFVNNTGVGASHFDTTASGTVHNNLFWGNTLGHYEYNKTKYTKVSVLNSGFSYAKNNIEGDPKFVAAASGDVRATFGSPLIDVGLDFPKAGLLDPYGVSRNLDGDRNGYTRTDIGAFEFTSVLLDYSGTPSPGKTLTILTSGRNNTPVIMAVGLKPLRTPYYLGQLGTVIVDVAAQGMILGWPAVGTPSKFPVPPGTTGFSVLLQCAAGTSAWGNLSNALDIRFR